MAEHPRTYLITRADRAEDPLTIVADGLALGRLPDCEVNLNHPTVSRLHAGIRQIDGDYYLFHLSPSNSTTLNGKLVEEKAALADGDTIQIGPFFLSVDIIGERLSLSVRFQPAVRIGDAAQASVMQPAPARAREKAEAFDIFWQKRKREAGQITRSSVLRPRAAPRLGKTRYNWTPTRDLARPYPFALFTWALIALGALTAVAAFGYPSAFAPAPLSDPHTRAIQLVSPAIANRPNANSCTTCHTVSRGMEASCASCHRTEAFVSTPTDAHTAAGVGCVTCHAEHRGRDFRPALAPLSADFQKGVAREQTCAGCHSDDNHTLYKGRRVFTPHGGTLGYPVVDGRWKWEGLSDAEWDSKPDELKNLLATWKPATEDARRSVQFHALHLHRVRAVGGIKGNEAGELSCSSCHKSLGASLDRATPRTTCAACHSGMTDSATRRAVIPANAANCTSCHVQHLGDRRAIGAASVAVAEHRPGLSN